MNAREAAAARRQQGPGGTVATQQDAGATGTMRTLLDRMKPELALALPKHMTAERMARQALTVFRTVPKLDECTPQSFLGALMTCAQVGLEPGPQGHVWLIPFRNKGRMEATFILGYQGMIELARRSGELVDIAAHTVYQNEVDQGRFKVRYGTDHGIEHDPIVFGDRGKPVGYYAMAKLRSGGTPFVVLSRGDVENFRARSKTQGDNPSGPWMTDYEAMAWKTCVRRLSRWLPQSPELAAAIAHEETVRTETAANVLEQQPPTVDEDGDDVSPHPSQLEGTSTRPEAAPHPQHRAEPQQQRPAYQPGDLSDARATAEEPEEYPEPTVPEPGGDDDPWANV